MPPLSSVMPTHRPQSRREEVANALTHGTGLALSLVGLPILVLVAARHGDVRQVVACSIFATTLVLLYAASTAYHAVSGDRAKQALRVVDHVAIYLLIAGTYTPFVFGLLRGVLSWTLLGVVWGLAIFGILYKTLLGFRFPRLSTALYIGMGWLAVVAIPPLARAMPPAGLAWLIAGGLCYTGGVVFYVRGHRPYRHAVWHLFVLAGSACHYAAVLGYATGVVR
ncbi:MAG: hemolysin III family protein [Gemmatimonadetes bacterium]|nr:hemolysin III family protein [Gemmatimonadota bacterium]